MAQRRLTHSLLASITTAQEATMHSQLTHIIAQQHQADLVQTAARERLVAEATAQHSGRRPAAGLNRFRGRITATVVQAAARPSRFTL